MDNHWRCNGSRIQIGYAWTIDACSIAQLQRLCIRHLVLQRGLWHPVVQMFVVGIAFPIWIFTLHIAVFIAQSGPCRPLFVIVDVVGVCSEYTGGMSELIVSEEVDTVKVLSIVAVVVAIVLSGDCLYI